jgi:CubicO group peptidase (beta-lactamase class C family)
VVEKRWEFLFRPSGPAYWNRAPNFAGLSTDLLLCPSASSLFFYQHAINTYHSQHPTMKIAATVLASTLAMATAASPAVNATQMDIVFEEVREVLDGFNLVGDMAFSIGDSRGELWRHEKGATTFNTQMGIASATKWVSSTTIMSVVQTGVLDLDDLASKHLDYWTTDQSDPRSRVTLRHFLSFVAGVGGSTACSPQADFLECVEEMYSRSSADNEPGAEMVYNEVALMYAGAMASAASGTPMEDLFEQYVFEPTGMTSTVWGGNGRPVLGSGLSTTPEDYGKFLNAYFNGDLVSDFTRSEMERCHYVGAALGAIGSLQGQYGLGNWFQCIPALQGMRPECEAAEVHMSVGIQGYYPSTDRAHDFWMQVGTQSATGAVTSPALELVLRPVAIKAILDSREQPTTQN